MQIQRRLFRESRRPLSDNKTVDLVIQKMVLPRTSEFRSRFSASVMQKALFLEFSSVRLIETQTSDASPDFKLTETVKEQMGMAVLLNEGQSVSASCIRNITHSSLVRLYLLLRA